MTTGGLRSPFKLEWRCKSGRQNLYSMSALFPGTTSSMATHLKRPHSGLPANKASSQHLGKRLWQSLTGPKLLQHQLILQYGVKEEGNTVSAVHRFPVRYMFLPILQYRTGKARGKQSFFIWGLIACCLNPLGLETCIKHTKPLGKRITISNVQMYI